MVTTRVLQRVMLGVATLLVLTCSSPTETANPTNTTPTDQPPPPITSISIGAPPYLIVNETALLNVVGQTTGGPVMVASNKLHWVSNNKNVATVSADGVVTSVARGSVTITGTLAAVAPDTQLTAAAQLAIKARVTVTRVFARNGDTIPLVNDAINPISVGDTIQFVTQFTDVNGFILGPAATQSWSSSAPDVVSVSSSGRAIGLQHVPGSIPNYPCTTCVVITASTEDGTGSAPVFVTDIPGGLPATVRFAHTASALGPLTFVPSQGAPVVLSFGQSVERSITSGSFTVYAKGISVASMGDNTVTAVIRGGDYVSTYAVTFAPPEDTGELTWTWSTPGAVAADSGYVRFVSGGFGTRVYVRDSGAAIGDIGDLCYFDLGSVSGYFHRAAGNFDVIASGKTFGVDTTRKSIIAPAGSKYTYVFVGYTSATWQVLAFPDP